ncbi:MAG TPA: hypothetical protein VGV87_01005 [Blastocatellia bacterium]|nr:hypothetical protein [Blastocatellia bacterium]
MFELTGKPEMWSAGRDQMMGRSQPGYSNELIKLHPRPANSWRSILRMALGSNTRRRIADKTRRPF